MNGVVRTTPLGRFAPLAIVAVIVAVLPFVVPAYVTFELTYVGAYAIAILGLVVLTGMNGQISLGHGAFVAAGGYAVAVLGLRAGVPYWIAIPLAAALCGVFGALIGLVALRLEGVYLALATFALAVATPAILKHFKDLTGGVGGLTMVPVMPPAGIALSPERWLYLLSWLIAALLFALTTLLLRGRVGRALRALRDNEIAAISFGVNPYYYKTLAFGWSAALAGVAGALVALATAFVSPDTYSFALSISLLIGGVLGGLGTMWGALVGGVVVVFLPLWAQKISAAAPSVVYGVALIVVMIFAPGGISGVVQRLLYRLWPSRDPAVFAERRTPASTPLTVNQPTRE